jgi:branched-chain amino acid transport system permease protein
MSVLGVLVQVVVLRPLVGRPVISIVMVTIGLSIFFQALLRWMFGAFVQPFPQVFATKSVQILGLNVETAYLMSLVISVIIMAGFAYFFKFSRMGLAMRATAFDQQAAQSMGISVKHVFAIAWAISAAVSALAGVVVGLVSGVSASVANVGVKVFPAVILGGLESVIGAVVGGLLIGLLEGLAQFLDVEYLQFGNLITIAPFYAMLLILLIKPYGLLGNKAIERV